MSKNTISPTQAVYTLVVAELNLHAMLGIRLEGELHDELLAFADTGVTQEEFEEHIKVKVWDTVEKNNKRIRDTSRYILEKRDEESGESGEFEALSGGNDFEALEARMDELGKEAFEACETIYLRLLDTQDNNRVVCRVGAGAAAEEIPRDLKGDKEAPKPKEAPKCYINIREEDNEDEDDSFATVEIVRGDPALTQELIEYAIADHFNVGVGQVEVESELKVSSIHGLESNYQCIHVLIVNPNDYDNDEYDEDYDDDSYTLVLTDTNMYAA